MENRILEKSFFNWSAGKDSAFALYKALENGIAIDLLLTTLSADHKRISMHGIHEDLLKKQTAAIGIKSKTILLEADLSMDSYDQLMLETLQGLKSEGYCNSYYGDIFLEDLKNYRENQLKKAGFKGHFPLWKSDTSTLINEFIDLGFKTKIVAINTALVPEEFIGETIDHHLIKNLPQNVDPCGENGEFHTFVYDGPIFKNSVIHSNGEVVEQTYEHNKVKHRYLFQDLEY